MFTVNIDPMLAHFGPLMLHWYGVIVAVALGVGIWVSFREATRKGISENLLGDAILWLFVGGIIGARLFHVLDHWTHEFAANPIRILYIWEGGMAIWGAVAGGLAAIALFAWWRSARLSPLLDCVTPGLVLGQAIGRIACIITGDAVGKATAGPFGLAYSRPGALVPQLGVYYTPTPVYEILMNLAIFAIIWRLRRRQLPDGALFLTYLVLYSTGRFFVTFWSAYEIVAFGLNQAQLISLGSLALGLPLLVYLLRNRQHRQSSVRGLGESA